MNEIFKAIYDRLSASLTETVYDHVPQDLSDSDYPYVKLHTLDLEDGDTDLEEGFNAEFKVTAFSRYRGSKEIATLQENIYNSIHRYNFPDTTSYGITGCHQASCVITTLDDGLTRMSAQRFIIIFEPLPI